MLQTLVIGFALGANDFAAALALGSLGQKRRRWLVAPIVGLAHLVVVWAGMALGRSAAFGPLFPYAHEIAPFVLAAVGVWMLRAAMRPERREEKWAARAATLGGAILLAIWLSVDSLLIGVGIGLRGHDPATLAVVAAVVATITMYLGMTGGDRLRRDHEKDAEIASALLILALGAAASLDWI